MRPPVLQYVPVLGTTYIGLVGVSGSYFRLLGTVLVSRGALAWSLGDLISIITSTEDASRPRSPFPTTLVRVARNPGAGMHS